MTQCVKTIYENIHSLIILKYTNSETCSIYWITCSGKATCVTDLFFFLGSPDYYVRFGVISYPFLSAVALWKSLFGRRAVQPLTLSNNVLLRVIPSKKEQNLCQNSKTKCSALWVHLGDHCVGFIGHRGRWLDQLLRKTNPVAPTLLKPCCANPIQNTLVRCMWSEIKRWVLPEKDEKALQYFL